MANPKPEDVKPEDTIAIPAKLLRDMQEQMAKMESDRETERGRLAALELMVAEGKDPESTGAPKLRERQSYEPKFHTVRLRKFPIKGNVENEGYVVGWTNRGAYQEVDRTGVTPQMVDYIEIIFLGKERGENGKLQAEKVRLLDLVNAPQVICKIVNEKKTPRKVPTGEEIGVTVFDPAHGLTETGNTVDGWSAFTDIVYTIQVPGISEPIEVDSLYLN